MLLNLVISVQDAMDIVEETFVKINILNKENINDNIGHKI